jgi:hypothetical protein
MLLHVTLPPLLGEILFAPSVALRLVFVGLFLDCVALKRGRCSGGTGGGWDVIGLVSTLSTNPILAAVVRSCAIQCRFA